MKLKELGIVFTGIYLAITGIFALFVALAFYYLGLRIVPIAITFPLALVFLVYGSTSVLASYFLLKKEFFGWFLSIVLLSIQGLSFAFSFSTLPTIVVVAMLVFLVLVKDEFRAYAPVRAETTQAPKMPEMKFVIFNEEERNKFVKRKKR